MFLIVGKRAGPLLRGSYESGRRFCEWFPNDVKFIEACGITNFDQLKQYDKVIFRTHGPNQYKIPINIVTLQKVNHLIFTRQRHMPRLCNSCSNGFYFYKNHSDIKHYIPMVSPFHVTQTEFERPCLGYYERNCANMDAYKVFKSILKSLKTDVDVCFMGNPPKEQFELWPHVKRVSHTYNNVKFFETISHYTIPDSIYSDTFCNSMMEAVQTNKQIISPPLKNKKEKHGIDDIKDCIDYHIEFDPHKHIDNSNTILKAENFESFYRRLFTNNFEYSFDRSKFNTFREWIEREVL